MKLKIIPRLFFECFIGTIFICLSCGESRENKLQVTNSEITQEESQRENRIRHLATKLKASLAIDTTYFNYTYEYQNLIGDHNSFLLTDFYIFDAIKGDTFSSIVLKKRNRGKDIYIQLNCNEELFISISDYIKANKTTPRRRITNTALLFVVQNIKKVNFGVNMFGEADEEGNVDTYIEIDSSDCYLFTGSLSSIEPL